MTAVAFDAVIAGGGLSGLSLAGHLACGGWRDRSVLVVDDDALATAATSWAYWSAAEGPLDSAVSHVYRQVRMYAAGTSFVIPLGRYDYRVVRRSDLRSVVERLVKGCPGFAIVRGHVDAVRDGDRAAEVVIDGRTVHTSWAFNSVMAGAASTPADAYLAFTGEEIRCDEPRFDPDTPVLMDFRATPGVGARFAYVLPTNDRQALVELTEFVPRHCAAPTAAQRREALAAYVRDVIGSRHHQVLRAESAVLPLRAYPGPRRHGRVLDIGVRGGMMKASTGYAYQRIQRDSRAIVSSLTRNGHPFDVPPSRPRHQLLDAVLLDVLDRDPQLLELAFARLFQRQPAERVLAFLDEDTGFGDELRLINTLPKAPYVRALVRRMSSRSLRNGRSRSG
jgi:lycopene beta-cyclase